MGICEEVSANKVYMNIHDRSSMNAVRILKILIIGERKRASLVCLIIRIFAIFIYIFQAVRRARAVNALRANVGPVEVQWSI